jgi:hypothetical protein
VQPGVFKVTLNKIVDGELTPVGATQEFNVVPLPAAKPLLAEPASEQ